MRKAFRTFALAAFLLLASASFVFADIAPLPDPEPEKSRVGILVVLGAVIIALLVVRSLIRKKRGK